jgi:methyl-accepting chemotaxis protein
MKWNVASKLGLGFGIVLAIFVIVAVVSHRAVTELVAAAEIRDHTHQVINQLSQARGALRDMESSQRTFMLTGEDSYLLPWRAAQVNLRRAAEALRKLTADNARQQARLDRIIPLIEQRIVHTGNGVQVRQEKGLEASVQYVRNGDGNAISNEILGLVQDMESDETALLKQRSATAEANTRFAEDAILFGTLGGLVLAALAGVLISRNIARPLGQLTVAADRITIGDLGARIPEGDRGDEVGLLSQAFNRMVASLRTMAGAAEQIATGDLRSGFKPQSEQDVVGLAFVRMTENLRQQLRSMGESASILASSASQIVTSTAQFSTSATESATAVSETTTTVEEVRQTAQMASQKARAVSENAQRAMQATQAGRKSTEELIAGMSRIRQQMEAIAESMVRLSEQSQTIGQIIATVEDLAAQSNLLAVNAAIEAAKAGEHGKGFGVVAQEVKSLAEQSRQATNQVRTILGDIQKATTAAVMATEQGAKAVENGGRQTETAGESIQALSTSVAEAAQAATQIAASSQQQLIGMDQVAVAMESIKQASTQSVASARDLETAARNLDDLGRRVKQMVDRYTL